MGSMGESQQSDGSEPPVREFETDGVDVAVRSQGVEWDAEGTGLVAAHYGHGDVDIALYHGKGGKNAGVSAYFGADEVREMVDAIKNRRAGSWETGDSLIWLDRGWLYHEGTTLGDDDDLARVSFEPDGERVGLCCVYEGAEEGNTIRASTTLTGSELETLATALEHAAEQADEHASSGKQNANEKLENEASKPGVTQVLFIGLGTLVIINYIWFSAMGLDYYNAGAAAIRTSGVTVLIAMAVWKGAKFWQYLKK